jgi:hypothetical protein
MQVISIYMSDARLLIELSNWQEKLQLQHYQIVCQRIRTHQVCDNSDKRGHEFVGICTDHNSFSACLYHTRKLHIDDLVHELLHVKYPLWSEKQVNDETERILKEKEVRDSEIL